MSIRSDTLALKRFIEKEGVVCAMSLAENDIEAFIQPLTGQIAGQLLFDMGKGKRIRKNFGFDDIVTFPVQNQYIRTTSPSRYFDQGITTQPLNKKVDKAIQRIAPGTFAQLLSVKGVKAAALHIFP
jgi:hypothetical protein